MFREDFDAIANAAEGKRAFLAKNPFGYFLLSVLAGMYIGFGVLLAFTVGGLLSGAPATKLAMGACFGVALSLVTMAGAELFTGNNLVMTAGLLKRTVKLSDTLKLWLVCWLGNAAGGVLLALLYHLTGLGEGAVGEFMAAGAYAKMTAGPVALLTRGILCNVLVCLAVWCSFRCKTEIGKLVMIFWCLLAFFTTGFEHSVANMTLLSVALLRPVGQAVSLLGWGYNLLFVTLGNMVGSIFLIALPYYAAGREK